MTQAKPIRTLSAWVEYIQTLHLREIDMSLDRVRQVYRRLCPSGVNFRVIGVAGTNGKGSTAELISSIYRSAGYQTGKYTSPHITKFNERINVNGVDVDDTDLLWAFERVEHAREQTRLTFFEFGTLLAIEIFAKAKLDIVVMEVGLGGRLDATNILDADVSVVTSISIDHTAWLGGTIEEIAAEKIGIARANRPCVLGMPNPPKAILKRCRQLNISPLIYQRDFDAKLVADNSSWKWQSADKVIESLALPFGQAGHQIDNAAVAIQAVLTLDSRLPVDQNAIKKGIAAATLSARCQLLSTNPYVVIDVAHNVESVVALGGFVQRLQVKGRVYAVCGMLRDKEIAKTLIHLVDIVDEWHFASIDNPRGATAREVDELLRACLAEASPAVGKFDIKHEIISKLYASAPAAYSLIRSKLKNDDCLIVFGSFYIVGDIMTDEI